MAVIPDGNRRIGERDNVSLIDAYVRGARRAIAVAKRANEKGVRHLTFFGLSIENVEGRPDSQIEALMRGASLFLDEAEKLGWAIRPFGNIHATLSGAWYETMRERLIDLRKRYRAEAPFTLHVAVNYSGRPQHELAPLVEDLYRQGFPTVGAHLKQHLLSGGVPDVDLLIRTGGEQRLSGFLPFQAGYAELYFARRLWGDFTPRDFEKSLAWFAKQKRNFGA